MIQAHMINVLELLTALASDTPLLGLNVGRNVVLLNLDGRRQRIEGTQDILFKIGGFIILCGVVPVLAIGLVCSASGSFVASAYQ